ncbi:uncharacterized protein LOC103093611 [Monodelphis domestica]|uniref:uncharacterized protein LOC103093611 n=1 Tax=Monodelphis domestica TaxID=13616 RepID=UPI0024E1E569|nr:uncharacterized protein LOC103093611 [Monodelphis domestica]
MAIWGASPSMSAICAALCDYSKIMVLGGLETDCVQAASPSCSCPVLKSCLASCLISWHHHPLPLAWQNRQGVKLRRFRRQDILADGTPPHPPAPTSQLHGCHKKPLNRHRIFSTSLDPRNSPQLLAEEKAPKPVRTTREIAATTEIKRKKYPQPSCPKPRQAKQAAPAAAVATALTAAAAAASAPPPPPLPPPLLPPPPLFLSAAPWASVSLQEQRHQCDGAWLEPQSGSHDCGADRSFCRAMGTGMCRKGPDVCGFKGTVLGRGKGRPRCFSQSPDAICGQAGPAWRQKRRLCAEGIFRSARLRTTLRKGELGSGALSLAIFIKSDWGRK